ncbi:hypothetical protein [Nocardioides convexus]|uniref:hypothetical protein n=1 Tax=Nocardioides convexus TaxID=2712224 RepID=UPI002418969F|nr:hypothetical protein [Nocardioides convexus]
MAYAKDLLARTGVAVATGVDFDTVDGGRFLRIRLRGLDRRRHRGAGPSRRRALRLGPGVLG